MRLGRHEVVVKRLRLPHLDILNKSQPNLTYKQNTKITAKTDNIEIIMKQRNLELSATRFIFPI